MTTETRERMTPEGWAQRRDPKASGRVGSIVWHYFAHGESLCTRHHKDPLAEPQPIAAGKRCPDCVRLAPPAESGR